MRWEMQAARMAQIRRDCDLEVATATRAEIFALPRARPSWLLDSDSWLLH